MARNKTLAQLVSGLRLEIGSTNSVSVGADFEENVKQLLRRTQELLYDDYDWPHLNIITSKALTAGSRFYDMPANLNFDRIANVAILYGGTYVPVKRGIGFQEYSSYDPAADERTDPVKRWDVRYTGSADQIEVWPLPASAQTLYFEGIRDLPALTSDSSVAVLDDQLIILYAAAEMLAKSKSANAGSVQQKAQDRYSRLKSNSKSGSSRIQLGLGDTRLGRNGPSIVQVAS